MKCAKCSSELPSDAKYCPNCGWAGDNTPDPDNPHGVGEHVKPPVLPEEMASMPKKTSGSGKAFKVIGVIVVLIALGYYFSSDVAVDKNNSAMDSYDKGGDYMSTVDSLEEAVKDAQTDEDKIIILMNMAYVYTSEWENDKAIDAFNRALELAEDGGYYDYLINAEIEYIEGDYEESLRLYEKAYDKDPNDYPINASLGLYWLDMEMIGHEDLEQAVFYLEQAYDIDPYAEAAMENLALAYFFSEHYQDSLDLFKKTSYKNKPFIRYYIGLNYLMLEEDDKAREHFKAAMDGGVEIEDEIKIYLDL